MQCRTNREMSYGLRPPALAGLTENIGFNPSNEKPCGILGSGSYGQSQVLEGSPDCIVETREEGSWEVRGAASLGWWADSGVTEHWLMGWVGERRSAGEWTLGAETEFRGHGVWHPSAFSSSPSICSFTKSISQHFEQWRWSSPWLPSLQNFCCLGGVRGCTRRTRSSAAKRCSCY